MGKRIYSLLAGIGFLLAAGQASATIIQDNYWGADGFSALSDRDVIASAADYNHYNISSMDVSFSGDSMTVRVYTGFNESNDDFGVLYGDLFISTDGWHPDTSAAHYANDNIFTGEKWEYVFDTSGGSLHGGNFDIYTSNHFFGGSGYYYRQNQEVQYAGGGSSYTGSSVDLSHAGQYIEYNILLSSLGIQGPANIGLKWGMTCSNDSIEGQVSVPEPSALMLLGLGLLGLGVTARKRSS